MHGTLPIWIGFNAAVVVLLVVDMVGFRRGEKVISMREAAVLSVAAIAMSLAFAAFIYVTRGPAKGVEFITGYVIEYSLSMDNLFVFIMIFAYFKIPPALQHRVLGWGIFGALILRGVTIALGVELVNRVGWVLYGFGAFVLITGIRMLFKKDEENPNESFAIKLCGKIPRVTKEFHGAKLFVRDAAGWMMTPLALAVVVIDVMDLAFAVDSVPAVFAVTRDPLIVYTSNICAILGLRSLYFILAGAANRFGKLHYGIAGVLIFIGVKMLLAGVFHISNGLSLLAAAVLLGASVIWSLMGKEEKA
jgi:tellurite resistance protein TerC